MVNNYTSLICEIFNGFTPIKVGAELLYLRHINLHDQANLTAAFERQKQRAIDSSIPTEAELTAKIKENGEWPESDQLLLVEKESHVETLKNTKKALQLKSQKDEIQKTIDEETVKINELLFKKRAAICQIAPSGRTAEDYAAQFSNEEFIRHLVYSDKELKQLRYGEEEFAELDLKPLMDAYYKVADSITDDTIQHIVLSDAFSLYIGQTDKPYDFFARPIVSLSIHQLKLLVYGRMFLNIFQNVENIPESIKKSPQELLDFVDSQRKREKTQQKGGKTHKNMGLVGATGEDLDYYDPSAKKMSLAEELKKNGGKMNAQQMMALMNKS